MTIRCPPAAFVLIAGRCSQTRCNEPAASVQELRIDSVSAVSAACRTDSRGRAAPRLPGCLAVVAPYEVLAPQAAATPPLGGAEAERAAPQVAPAAPVVRLAVPPAEVGALCAERNARAAPTVVPAE